jgi:hypothetical protein
VQNEYGGPDIETNLNCPLAIPTPPSVLTCWT